MKRKHILIFVFISIIFVRCGPANNKSGSEITPSKEVQQPIQTSETTSIQNSQNSGQTDIVSWSGNADDLLKSAVQTLQESNSFHIEAHETRAYQAMPANGEETTVYGDFLMKYDVIRTPTLKIHTVQSYRYDPQAGFETDESFTFQLNDQYVYQTMENGQMVSKETIDVDQVEPLAGDVYQTLIQFSDQAVFVGEKEGEAIYVLDHPQWYVLNGALGFADLGMMRMLGMSKTEIEQYALENYPSAKPIRFTIYVSSKEQVFTKVVVDDRDFMLSVWVDVNHALIESGANPESLINYEVLDENGSEYFFNDYNQVEDFDVPS